MPLITEDIWFIHIPKTGGTSIKETFGYVNFNDKTYDDKRQLYATCHLTPEENVKFNLMTEEDVKNLYSFCFVRNPWDKLVSDYCRHGYRFVSSYENYIDEVAIIAEKHRNGIFAPSDVFKDYWQDNHYRPQCDFLFYKDELIPKDIWRFEDHPLGYNEASKIIGVEKKIKKVNKSKHRHYSSYYSTRTRKMVKEIFKKDIEYLNYKFSKE